MKLNYFLIILLFFSLFLPASVFGIKASEFAAWYPDLWPSEEPWIPVKVVVSGQPESDDPSTRAKEIRQLQAGPVKFAIRAGAINVVSDTWNNEFTANVPAKAIQAIEDLPNVVSIEVIEEKLPPKQVSYEKISQEVNCKESHVLIFRYDSTTACVKPTSVYPLLQRGWASSALTDTAAMSLDVSKWFIRTSPTFAFDGMDETLDVKIVTVRESFPEQYVIEADFSTLHGGYGDRTDQIVTQAITPHKMNLVVSSGNVVSATIDEKWDEINQKPWKTHILPDVDSTVTQNSDAVSSGTYSVETSFVKYNDSTGFLAKPTTGTFPGVVMIHEWWGLNENIQDMASELASQGYVVLAVDLFGGEVASTAEHAMELVAAFEQDRATSNMNSAANYLMENQNVDKLGSIGWCFGGAQSLNLALNNENMDATVIYYGRLVTEPEQLSQINWPVLGIFAELDQGISVENVNKFESALNELDIPNEIHIYPGVDHAFANPTGSRYAPEETEDAWKKTLDFLNTNLK